MEVSKSASTLWQAMNANALTDTGELQDRKMWPAMKSVIVSYLTSHNGSYFLCPAGWLEYIFMH